MITARFGSDTFSKLMDEIAAALDRRENPCIIFFDGTSQEKQSVLAALADRTSLDISQRDAAALVGERPLQTQGNLREAFDTTGDVPTILAFANADALFVASRREEDDPDPDAHTATDYLFERIEHKPGITVLQLSDPQFANRATEAIAFALVEF